MKCLARVASLCGISFLAGSSSGAESAAAAAWQRFSAQSQAAIDGDGRPTPAAAADPGVPLLSFTEFFGPVGDRGLEYSDALRALAGQRVRLSGYMVREQNRASGVFMLTARPARVQQSEYCSYDDLPTAVAHVILRSGADTPVPFQPGRLELVGTLELGPRPETDGRNSTVRLILDAEAAASLLGETPGQ